MQEKSLENGLIFANLGELIAQSGKKQIDIAQALDVSPITVNRWVNGGRRISKKNLHALCRFLGADYNHVAGQVNKSQDVNLANLMAQHGSISSVGEPTYEEWKQRALVAEAKLKHLQSACTSLGQHVAALGSTVEGFSKIISE